jgi:hypothetical protein
MAGAMEKDIALPCEVNTLQMTAISVDIYSSTAAYKALQDKCMNGKDLDVEKMKQFMEFFYAEKFCSATHEWKMNGMKQWDEALEEVYNTHF